MLWIIIQSRHILRDQFLKAHDTAWGTALDSGKGPFPYRVLPTQHRPAFDKVSQPSAEAVISAWDQTLMESCQVEEKEN